MNCVVDEKWSRQLDLDQKVRIIFSFAGLTDVIQQFFLRPNTCLTQIPHSLTSSGILLIFSRIIWLHCHRMCQCHITFTCVYIYIYIFKYIPRHRVSSPQLDQH